MTSRGQSLFNALRQSRRGTRLAVVAAILAVVITLVWPALPGAARVSYRLPEGLRSLSVEYETQGEIVRTARFGWSGASPGVLRHEPELSPGWYVIDVTIEGESSSRRHVRRSVRIDPKRVTHVDLRGAE